MCGGEGTFICFYRCSSSGLIPFAFIYIYIYVCVCGVCVCVCVCVYFKPINVVLGQEAFITSLYFEHVISYSAVHTCLF
jgi:hypothetical protein